MITTTVPAQITSVEDKIAANLSLLQVVLLVMPVCLATVLIIIFPPNLKISAYKVFLVCLVALTCGVFAIRWKNELVIHKFLRRMYFYKRPSIYLSTIAPRCNCNEAVEEDVEPRDSLDLKLLKKRPPLEPVQLASVTERFEKNNKGFIADKEGNLNAIIGFKA